MRIPRGHIGARYELDIIGPTLLPDSTRFEHLFFFFFFFRRRHIKRQTRVARDYRGRLGALRYIAGGFLLRDKTHAMIRTLLHIE